MSGRAESKKDDPFLESQDMTEFRAIRGQIQDLIRKGASAQHVGPFCEIRKDVRKSILGEGENKETQARQIGDNFKFSNVNIGANLFEETEKYCRAQTPLSFLLL